MAGKRSRSRENHRPRYVADTADHLGIDKIRSPPEEKTERYGGGRDVPHCQGADALHACEDPHGRDAAEQSAVKCHAALPDLQDLQWMTEIIVRFIEKDVAEPSAHHDADRNPGEEVVGN